MKHSVFLTTLAAVVAVLSWTQRTEGQCQYEWRLGDGVPVTDGLVFVLTIWDPDGPGPQLPLLVAGGSFSLAGSAVASNIAVWNDTAWLALGTGMNSSVSALTVYNGNLIAGGSFIIAGGTAANRIAQSDGNTWTALGTGMNSSVSTLTVYDGNLIAGGASVPLVARRPIASPSGTAPLGRP